MNRLGTGIPFKPYHWQIRVQKVVWDPLRHAVFLLLRDCVSF